MRIISGEYRRRRLHANPGQTTRPITDRAKESLFSNIEWRLPGARVADVFAGTGSLGLEAVSRGAAAATFLERDRMALGLLRQNIEHVGVDNRTMVWPADILRCSWKPKNAEAFTPWTVIFFDPPYAMVEDMKPGRPIWTTLERMARTGVAADDALLIFRTPRQARFAMPAAWQPQEPLIITSMAMNLFLLRPGGSSEEPPSAAEPTTQSPHPEG